MFDPPATEDPDSLRIASRNLNARFPWLPTDQRVPYGHVLNAAAQLGWRPADVVARLTELGYADIEPPGTRLPEAVAPDDIPLLRDVGARYTPAWLESGGPVGLRQVLETAGVSDRAPAEVARRLSALGYRLGTGSGGEGGEGGDGGTSLPETPHRGDVVLISLRRGRNAQWLDWGDEVPAYQVLRAAQELRCAPYSAATRLRALGLRLPYAPAPEDDDILRTRTGPPGGNGDPADSARRADGNDHGNDHGNGNGDGWCYGAPAAGHVLVVARETGRPVAAVLARMAELGCALPVVPDPAQADDLVILSERLDGRAPWLVPNTVVGLSPLHILRAALATGRPPADIAGRLTGLGHWVHENVRLPETAEAEDVRLLETVDRSFLDTVHLEHVLRSASLTGWSPAEVAARLTAFGHRLPDEVAYPEIRPAGARPAPGRGSAGPRPAHDPIADPMTDPIADPVTAP
ncbi:hypothetical protein AB0O07_17700 [Streptomyces sp. NPDC093085]|uniref:wHTH domain-containing protein n=1 Tax=Streptomyces sp. NPDC093085 TaxID=3155068 RepID=UPI00343A4237